MNKKLKKGLTTTMAAAMGLGVVIPAVPVIAAPATSSWVNTSAGWTYYQAGKKVSNGWVKDNGTWYYIDANGIMATGWRSVGGVWYFMDDNGAMATGWKSIGGKWYFMASNGAMQKGWYQVGPAWYFSNPNGDMVANQWVGNYYLGASGAMLANTLTPDNYFVDANGAWDGKAKYDLAAIETAVAKAETSKSQADVDAAKALVDALPAVKEKDAFTARLNAVVTKLQVASVSAVDATHVKVAFTQAVDLVSGSATANYALYLVGNSTNKVSSVELSADRKSAVLTVSALTNQDANYTLTVDGVKDAAGDVISDFSKVYTLSDTVRPTVGDLTFKDSKTIQFTLSEPVNADNSATDALDINDFVAVYDANGIKQFGFDETAGKASYNTTTGVVTVDVSTLSAGNYTLRVASLADKAGNLVNTNPTVKSFTISTDTVKPYVSSLKQIGIKGSDVTAQGVLQVTFSEPLTAKFGVKVDNVTDGTAAITNPSGDKKTFLVVLTANSNTAGLHKIEVNTYADLATNAGDAYTQYVTFAAGSPAVSSTNFVTTTTGNKIVVKFDRDVTALTLAGITGVTYVTPTHVEKTLNIDSSAFSVSDIDDDGINELVIDADNYDGASAALPAGTYSVTLPASSVKDSATQANSAASLSFTVPSNTTASAVTVDGTAANTKQLSDVNYVQVIFTDEVDANYALDVNNYTVEGQKVFTSAIFTDDAHTTVKLKLAANAVTADGTYNFNVNGVKDADGNAVTAYAGKLNLKENEKPYIAKAEVTANNTVVVTFNEALSGTVNANDFVVSVNGSALSLTSTDASLSGSVVTITLPTPLTSTSDVVTVKTDTDFDGVDANGNTGVIGQTVTGVWK